MPPSRNPAVVRFQLAWLASYAAKGVALLFAALWLARVAGGGP